jgi:hypothetical protein
MLVENLSNGWTSRKDVGPGKDLLSSGARG